MFVSASALLLALVLAAPASPAVPATPGTPATPAVVNVSAAAATPAAASSLAPAQPVAAPVVAPVVKGAAAPAAKAGASSTPKSVTTAPAAKPAEKPSAAPAKPAAATKEAAKETATPAAKTAVAAVPEKSKHPIVVLTTSLGVIKLELEEEKAPESVRNFLSYVDRKFYDGTVFHRVIAGFMIQGGGLTSDLREKRVEKPIRNEGGNGLRNVRGSVAMARRPDPDSATSQFFINVVDNAMLDRPNPDPWGYAVFGRVVEGMDVVDRIRAVPTGPGANGLRDVPRDPVVITSARRQR